VLKHAFTNTLISPENFIGIWELNLKYLVSENSERMLILLSLKEAIWMGIPINMEGLQTSANSRLF
jgi:hypothetical protein